MNPFKEYWQRKKFYKSHPNLKHCEKYAVSFFRLLIRSITGK